VFAMIKTMMCRTMPGVMWLVQKESSHRGNARHCLHDSGRRLVASPRLGNAAREHTFLTKVGDQNCGVGYHKG
jgi:hypothetical protein